MRILLILLLLFTAGCNTRFDGMHVRYGDAKDCPICRSKIDTARRISRHPPSITTEVITYIESDCYMCGRVNKARKEFPKGGDEI